MDNSRIPIGPSQHQQRPSNNNGPPPDPATMLASRRPPPLESIPPHTHRPPPLGHQYELTGAHRHNRAPKTEWSHSDSRTRPRMFGPDSESSGFGRVDDSGPASHVPSRPAPTIASSSSTQPPPPPPVPRRDQDAFPMSRNYSDESQRSLASNPSIRSHGSGEGADHHQRNTSQAPHHSSGAIIQSRPLAHDGYEASRLAPNHPQTDAQSEPASGSRSPPRQRRTRVLMTKMQWHALMALWEQTIFPATNEREALAQEIGLTPRQVQVWFQNQRQKRRREREIDEANAATAAAGGSMPRTAEAPPNWASSVHGAGALTAESASKWTPVGSISGGSAWSAHSAPAHLQTLGEGGNRMRVLPNNIHIIHGRPPMGDGPMPPMSNVIHSPREAYPQHLPPSLHDRSQGLNSRPGPFDDPARFPHAVLLPPSEAAQSTPRPPPPPSLTMSPYMAYRQQMQPPGPDAHGHQYLDHDRRDASHRVAYHSPPERRVSSASSGPGFSHHEPRDARVLHNQRPRTEEGPGPARPRSRSIAIANSRPYPPPSAHMGYPASARPLDPHDRHRPSFHRQHSVPENNKFSPHPLSPTSPQSLDIRYQEYGAPSYYSPASQPASSPGTVRQEVPPPRSAGSSDANRAGPGSGPDRPPGRHMSTLPPSLSSLVLDRPLDHPGSSPLSPMDHPHSLHGLILAEPEAMTPSERRDSEGSRSGGTRSGDARKRSPSLPSLARLLN